MVNPHLTATIAAIGSFPFVASLLNDPTGSAFFTTIADNENMILIGLLIQILMAVAIASIVILMYI